MKINYFNKFFPVTYKYLRYYFFLILNNLYRFFNYQKGVLVYFGVNEGESLTKIFYKFKRVICVEADSELCIKLKKKFTAKNVKIFNYLISSKNNKYGFLNIYKQDSSDATTDYRLNKKTTNRIKVPAIRPDILFKKLRIKYVDYYYSDLEGLDFLALKTLKNFIKNNKIRYIQHECNINKKKNPYKTLVNYESLFDVLLNKNYKKIAWGFGNLREGHYEKLPQGYIHKDILWRCKI